MGSPYTSKSSSGYNASPPSDDASATEANKIKWSTIKTKLPDVLKTFIEAINTALVEHFDRGPISKATAFTTTAAENDQTIEVSGTTTITLGATASMGAGYVVTIKNVDSNTVTVARSGSDTIDGATSVSLDAQWDSITVQVNIAEDGYLVIARDDPSITLPLPYSSMTFSNNIVAGDIATDAVGEAELSAAIGTPIILQSETASASSTITLNTSIGSTYDNYIIRGSNIRSTSAGSPSLIMRTIDAGGTNVTGYVNTNADTTYHEIVAAMNSTQDSQFRVYFSNPTNTVSQVLESHASGYSGGSTAFMNSNGGFQTDTAAVTGIEFSMSSDTIASGEFVLYGIKKA